MEILVQLEIREITTMAKIKVFLKISDVPTTKTGEKSEVSVRASKWKTLKNH